MAEDRTDTKQPKIDSLIKPLELVERMGWHDFTDTELKSMYAEVAKYPEDKSLAHKIKKEYNSALRAQRRRDSAPRYGRGL